MDMHTLSSLLDLVIQAAAILSPGFATYAYFSKKVKDELVTLLDKAPVQNTSLKNLATNLSLKQASKAIAKLQ